jgi:hypothetical protein
LLTTPVTLRGMATTKRLREGYGRGLPHHMVKDRMLGFKWIE